MTAVYDDVPRRVRRNTDLRLPFEVYADAVTPRDLAAYVDDIKAAIQLRVAPGETAPAAVEFSVGEGSIQIVDEQFIITAERGVDGQLPFPAGDYDLEVRFFRPGGLEDPAYVGTLVVEGGLGA